MRILIDNRTKRVTIDGVTFPVTSPALDASIDYVTWGDDGIGTIQYAGQAMRGNFADVSAYQPFVNAWMTAAGAALSLTQARTVKAELIATIAIYKRQRPVTATAGGVSRTWDGSDTALGHYGLIAGAGAAAQVAANANAQVNAALAAINPDNPSPPQVGIGGPSVTIQVCPLGSSTALSLTAGEMQGISNACAAQRVAVASLSQAKQNAVNALGTVAAVIAYDATAGW